MGGYVLTTATFHSKPSIHLMSELLTCGTNISLWQYDADGHLAATTSSHLILDKFLDYIGGKNYILKHALEHTEPLIFGSDMGLMWCSVSEHSADGLQTVYVIGPVFNSNISLSTIESSVDKYNISLTFRTQYIELMKEIPVVSRILLFPYTLMLHYCVTGEKLSRSDIRFQASHPTTLSAHDISAQLQKDRLDVWYAERALLRMIREGDLNYTKALSNANQLFSNTSSLYHNPMMQAIINATGFTTLCAREAISAGVSPDTAYTLADTHIYHMAECRSISELTSLSMTMYEDFLQLVRKHLSMPGISPHIQSCRDYIDLHAEQNLSLSLLAERIGYSEYYLSRKFKQEMGISITSYIKYVRVNRAKLFLTTTRDSIAKIAAELHFCSASHFSGVFKEVTGKTPQQYRADNQRC